jgi:hypothetical protein
MLDGDNKPSFLHAMTVKPAIEFYACRLLVCCRSPIRATSGTCRTHSGPQTAASNAVLVAGRMQR